MSFIGRPKCTPLYVLWCSCLAGAMLVFTNHVNDAIYTTTASNASESLAESGSTWLSENANTMTGGVNNSAPVIPGSLRKFSTRGVTARLTLIVTYARSGSSWLGDITSHAPEAFYVFEPLSGTIKEGYYYEGDTICFNNNSCRKSSSALETSRFMFEQLFYCFTCQFHKLHPKLKLNVLLKGTPALQVYTECLLNRTNKNCRTVLNELCTNSTNRILKVIRVSMELVRTMMGLFPQLQVVHLVRDPRAVTASRLSNVITFRTALDTDSQTIDLCNRVSHDFAVIRELRQRYPARFTTILYEDLAEDTQKQADRIFAFLNLKMADSVRLWIYNSTHKSSNGYFGTSRDDPVAMANKWRGTLDFETVLFIDKTCATHYQTTGYLPMQTEADLRNLTVPARTPFNYN